MVLDCSSSPLKAHFVTFFFFAFSCLFGMGSWEMQIVTDIVADILGLKLVIEINRTMSLLWCPYSTRVRASVG